MMIKQSFDDDVFVSGKRDICLNQLSQPDYEIVNLPDDLLGRTLFMTLDCNPDIAVKFRASDISAMDDSTKIKLKDQIQLLLRGSSSNDLVRFELDELMQLAAESFPNGPEAVIEKLGLICDEAPLVGCDGWCLRRNSMAAITINTSDSASRQRFTLAHELAHLLLGHVPEIRLPNTEPFFSDTQEERQADELAAELLMPTLQVKQIIGSQLPIHARTIRRLATAAKVSDIAATIRVVTLADELSLGKSSCVYFDASGNYQWQFGDASIVNAENAGDFRRQAIAAADRVARVVISSDHTVVASVIETPNHYSALFTQVLPCNVAAQSSTEERRQYLQRRVFDNDTSFQQSVAACTGHIGNQVRGKSVAEAIAKFDEQYLTPGKIRDSWNVSKLLSDEGREFLRLEFAKYCSDSGVRS